MSRFLDWMDERRFTGWHALGVVIATVILGAIQ